MPHYTVYVTLILVVVAPQFLQFALISFGTSVNSFHANGLLYTSSAAVPPSKKKRARDPLFLG